MKTHLEVVYEDEKKTIKTYSGFVFSMNGVRAKIMSFVANGYYIRAAMAYDVKRGARSNFRTINIKNYNMILADEINFPKESIKEVKQSIETGSISGESFTDENTLNFIDDLTDGIKNVIGKTVNKEIEFF